MKKSSNPEKDFDKTPDSFSESSEIVGVERADYRRGIILNSPEEFAKALHVYNGSSVQEARATQDSLMNELGNKGDGMGAVMLLHGGAEIARGFIERLTQDALDSLKSKGRFHRSFDYDAIGTNFLKTTVEGRKIGDIYTLELCAAYVGTQPEDELAQKLGKQQALVRSSVEGRLRIVDDWWFNLNLEDILDMLPIPAKQLKNPSEIAMYFASGGYRGLAPDFEFEHEGQRFALSVGLDAVEYLRPEGKEHGSKYMQARGNNIVGGAWTIYDETGSKKIAPRVAAPSIVLSVSNPGERGSRLPATTKENMSAIERARDYLAEIISPKE